MIRMFSFLMVIMLVSISLCPVATATDAVYEVFAEAGAESEADQTTPTPPTQEGKQIHR